MKSNYALIFIGLRLFGVITTPILNIVGFIILCYILESLMKAILYNIAVDNRKAFLRESSNELRRRMKTPK